MSAQYSFTKIEKKWQAEWENSTLYAVQIDSNKPKYYVLDMFPYPSGSGLHVGHPLGYIASDIVSRYKRLKGFNVLHPMGYDAFGLPAEQYAIQTGQHPSVTTEQNIKRFREQLNIMGFSYDWDRQVKTCDPNYYQFTQWIFSLFFNHWYNKSAQKAEPLSTLEDHFSANGSTNHNAHGGKITGFSAQNWQGFSPLQKHKILNQFRLAFIDETTVNWCEAMGTVLANEEVINGLSERGGYPVIRKKMKQWSLRITAYADRLIEGLGRIQWSDAIKEIQKNWIGRSQGTDIDFVVRGTLKTLKVFTTRPDTIFGATFMVVAPELENLQEFCSDSQWIAVQEYANKAKNRSEIDRMADTTKTGVFTGLEAINPFTGEPIPIWVSDYVLANYGTGVIMAVPAHDDRDFAFASTFNLPIVPVVKPANSELELPLKESFNAKDGICFNSGFLDGLPVKDAIQAAIKKIEKAGWGQAKVNYKLREAGFGRQRYWGEPFPITYNNEGIPQLENQLPVELPQVESYKPSGNGESPLSAVTDWVNTPQGMRETDTMPGWAGSSWYFLRYTDPNNTEVFASKEALKYWQQVDLYVGGSEHATGHLLYSRFWTKFLFDLGYITWDEPFQRLVNQGMIMGEDGQKMSKRWGNVVNPDDVCAQYGADTLRMYEMFLGPLTDSKPWNTNGIEGVSRFFGKFWRLFYEGENWAVSNEKATNEELKILNKTIKKVTEDIESMSFNTSVSAFMVATNELGTLKCRKREILEPILILLAPFAPHISEELWHQLGNKESIHIGNWPKYDASLLVENSFNYPISINGKTRAQIEFDLTASEDEIKQAVLNHELVVKWMEGKSLKKFILVQGRIVNVVV
ncbi:MAG: leucine--tRNA ligase [Flavobacteriaceae bacterium]|nr:leucine--tRNA ligase [Flavobacteriaceae bacterium]PHX77551.1 MAG: leucine--tRNA ligase [Flavobacteriales bacterium]